MMASESPTSSIRKVVVHLRATGDAPILKQAKFKIAGTDKFAKVIDFLRRQLHRDTLFVYVNSAFSPNPDELVIDLYNLEEWVLPFERSDTLQIMSRLRILTISWATKLKVLPALGRLESLEVLFISSSLDSVKRIGPEFFGISYDDVMNGR
ncbi:hypothetical protein GIB67_035572 [Kingdonia uniflora]|uniref:Ubiquitin-like protein ATG12 n=1 Tax=Kingdonia uniflora TaxID=39325 RepID=A0A7J7LD49_9MAGN|nr:hypothetical protein GIB67_035572 [Kingdonia uniflora]